MSKPSQQIKNLPKHKYYEDFVQHLEDLDKKRLARQEKELAGKKK